MYKYNDNNAMKTGRMYLPYFMTSFELEGTFDHQALSHPKHRHMALYSHVFLFCQLYSLEGRISPNERVQSVYYNQYYHRAMPAYIKHQVIQHFPLRSQFFQGPGVSVLVKPYVKITK